MKYCLMTLLVTTKTLYQNCCDVLNLLFQKQPLQKQLPSKLFDENNLLETAKIGDRIQNQFLAKTLEINPLPKLVL